MKSITIQIKVELSSRANLGDLNSVADSIFINEFSQIHLDSVEIDEGVGFTDSTLVTYVVTFAVSVASGVVANAVYALIGKSARRIFIGNRRVKPDIESVEQAIQTEVSAGDFEDKEGAEGKR